MPNFRLEPVTSGNWRQLMRLRVRPDQTSFVADNAYSLLEAHYHPEYGAAPYGIYADDDLIGFVMTCQPDKATEPATIWIMRYMIGADYQGKGFGKAAMLVVLEFLKRSGMYNTVKLSYVPDNSVAKNLYASVGFVEEGLNEEWGEIIAVCKLVTDRPEAS